MSLTPAFVLLNQSTAEALSELNRNLAYGLNASWLVITGIGIVTMQAGFMALEVGATRAKNVKATLVKNVIDHAVGAIAWYCVGFSLFLGNHPFAGGDDVTWFNHYPSEYARIFQQYGFAITSATIVSGALLSRCRLRVYVLFSLLLSLYIYPIVAHWCWAPGGFLYQLGYLDFAGSGVVHLLGGACALVGAKACGPRVGRFVGQGEGSERSKQSTSFTDLLSPEVPPRRHRMVARYCCNSKIMHRVVDLITLNSDPSFAVRDQPGHSAPMQCLGALFLYVAWFSFNAGSSGGLDTPAKVDSACRAAVNTMLAAASATIAALLWSDVVRKQYELELVINGLLAGLVAVTAPCAYCDPWAAIVVGVLAIPVYVGSSKFVLYGLHVDDPIDATAVHMANGALGVIWTGLVDLNNGLFYSGNPRLFGVQCLGVVCIAVWSILNAGVYFYFLKYTVPFVAGCLPETGLADDNIKDNSIVYSPDAQLVGLDFLYFGGSGFPEFDVEAVSEFNATQRIKEKFRAKRVLTMRLFDREMPELSFHGTRGGDHKHLSGTFQVAQSMNQLMPRVPSTTTMSVGEGGSVNNSPRGSMIYRKRPSEQTIVVDSHLFTMENPLNDEAGDFDGNDGNRC